MVDDGHEMGGMIVCDYGTMLETSTSRLGKTGYEATG
jgi:hypothetical protein